jgi:hypothetical protein
LLGFFIANFLILLPITAIVYLVFAVNKIGTLFWFLTTLSENLIIISFAVLSSLILKNSFSAILASFGFYALSRLMGMFVMAIDMPEDYSSISQGGLASALKILSVLFPRLDLFAQSSWAIYGIKENVVLLIILFQPKIPLFFPSCLSTFEQQNF